MLQNKNSRTGGLPGTIIDFKTEKKLREKRNSTRSRWAWIGPVWFATWAVGLSATAGALIGRWVDARVFAPFSISVALMLLGAVAGCILAWRWSRS